MKIGIDIRTLMDAQYSGVSEYSLNLIKTLINIDSKNQYKLFYNSFSDIDARMPTFEGAKIVKTNYPNKIFNYAMQNFFAYPKLDKLLDIDIFFAPHINFISFGSNCKKILTIHDLSYLRYPNCFSLRKNFWHHFLNVKKMVKQFDHIVAISENTKNDIIELLGVPERKIEVIYSGLSKEYCPVKGEDKEMEKVRQKYDLPEAFLFYLGTIEPRKNVLAIIKAFETYLDESGNRKLNLVLAGANGWQNRDIFKYLSISKYQYRIKYLGYIEATEKKYFYNLTKAFIFPSLYEGFGFPPLEAMACGTPVLTSNISSLPEVVSEAALLVDPTNIAEISEGISQILDNNDLRQDLVIKGLHQSRKFSWINTAQNYLRLY